ncbi:unnamed protein product [Calicophoron daubneyi]|uniref:Uncharacterized protein n=1 Tax=Calicophoron daubneyi TaxID=300641 RepID=A0AAV2TC26_CALDB
MEPDSQKNEFEQFEALQNSGLLDSLYESLTLKERAVAHYRGLDPVVRGRIRALKRIQYSTLQLEVQFYKELAKLEKKFATQYQKLFSKRHSIVCGDYEPNAEETNWFMGEEDLLDKADAVAKSTSEGDATVDNNPNEQQKKAVKGIPGFWMTVLKHAPLICDTIRSADLGALRYLSDVRSVPLEVDGKVGFEIQFEFEPNEYFTNDVLTKKYFLGYDLKEENPLSYDGPEVIASEGCQINWKPDKNLTLITSSKTHRSRVGLEKHTVTKSTSIESFFQFFDPPKSSNCPKGTNPILEQKVLEDYDLGQYLKERVIPRAVAYFTGEALDLDNDVDDGDEFPDDEFDEESEEEVEEAGEP